MPSFTWLIAGSPVKPIEQANTYFERVLTVEGLPETKVNKIKLVLRQLFQRRSCYYLCSAATSDPDIQRIADITADQLNPTFIEQAQEFLGFVYSSTQVKQVTGISVTGPVLANMLSLFAGKLNKKKAPFISNVFTLAVATEARRNKEQMLISFFEEMSAVERKLPIDEEDLVNKHAEKSARFMGTFDKRLESMLIKTEVQEERRNLQIRMEDYLRDLKHSNYNRSLERCKTTFHKLLDGVLSAKHESPTELERKLLDSIEEYQRSAIGPCSELVLSDNINVIVTFCTQTLRQADIDKCTEVDALKAEVFKLTMQLETSKESERALQQLVKETGERATKTLEAKDQQLTQLTSVINARVHSAEGKARELNREIASLKIELEQANKEKLLLAETQSEIHEKRIEEAEERYSKTIGLNARLNQQLEELRREFERVMSDKNTAINELTRKIKQLESHTESTPRQDAVIVMSVKDYLEGIQSNFTNDQMSRKKAIHYMEQLAIVQAELNKTRLAEQSQRLKLSEDYELRQTSLRSQLEASERHCAKLEQLSTSLQEALNKRKAEPEAPSRTDEAGEKSQSEDSPLKQSLLENHLEIQNEMIETQRQTIESLRGEVDEKVELISTLKFDVVAKEDDNDMLLQVIHGTLEFTKKLRPSLKNVFSAMHNPELKSKVEQLLTKHRVPFT
jgi:hypothetical protein